MKWDRHALRGMVYVVTRTTEVGAKDNREGGTENVRLRDSLKRSTPAPMPPSGSQKGEDGDRSDGGLGIVQGGGRLP